MAMTKMIYEPLIVELNADRLILSFDDAHSRQLVRDYCRSFLKKRTGSSEYEQHVPDNQLDDILEDLLEGLQTEMKEGKLHIELNP